MSRANLVMRLLPVLFLLGVFLPAADPSAAQVRDGATLTVLRGTVGVLKANGSPLSPATSGLSLEVGDQISTMANSGALITFFEGSEVELGSDTAIVIREATGQGTRANITIESLVGSTVHKVVSLTDPGSTYRAESGGTVALVRGTLFAHRTEPHGDVTVALAGCGLVPAASTQACLEFPRPGLTMRPGEVRTATARGDILTGNFSVLEPLFNVVAEPVEDGDSASGTDNPGLRTGSRAAPQGQSQQPNDEQSGPAASATPSSAPIPGQTVLTASAPTGSTSLQVASQAGFSVGDTITIGTGSNAETNQISGFGSILLAHPTTRDHQAGEPVVKGGAVSGGSGVPCNQTTNSGGSGVTTTQHNMGRTGGTFQFAWDAQSVPDQFEVLYENVVIFNTGSVSGTGSQTISFGPGSSFDITVRVTGPSGTAWDYVVGCPV